MAVDNGTCWTSSQGSTHAPTQVGAVQTIVVPVRLDPESVGWILSVGSMLIIGTNLVVGTALLLLIRKKGSQSWCFVLNLALADVLVGVAITGIASGVTDTAISPTAKTKCLMRMAFLTSTSAASILTMFLISLDRYLVIRLPLRYSHLIGTRMTAAALATLWLLSFVVGFLPAMVPQLQERQYKGSCTFFAVIQPKGIILVFCVCFFPLLSVFVYFYLDILKIACAHQRQIRQARLAGSHVPQPNRNGVHVKALRTVALLVGCFTLSWCPFFIVSTVQVLCHSCYLYHVIENDLWFLGLSNSLLNPLVYACWQREVRQELCALFVYIKRRLLDVTRLITHRGHHSEHAMTAENSRINDSPSASQPQIGSRQCHPHMPCASSL